MAFTRKLALAACSLTLLAACGADDPGVAVDPPIGCDPPSRIVADGSCVEPGVQDDGCLAGEWGSADGSCRPAGVPPSACAEGFEPYEQGCRALLPADPCPPGTMAIPGQTECREVAACDGGRWGSAPLDGPVQFVDQAYGGGANDGSEQRPWSTIGEALLAAAPGAVVAIAAGSYLENLQLVDRPVRLWGACTSGVEVLSSSSGLPTLYITASASGTEVHSLAVRGTGRPVVVQGAQDVWLDRLWIHDTTESGIRVLNNPLRGSARITETLVEGCHDFGIFVVGSDLLIDRTVVRDTQPRIADQAYGQGVSIQDAVGDGGPAVVVLRRSVVERNHDNGILAIGSTITIDESVVRSTRTEPATSSFGRGVALEYATDTGRRSSTAINASVIDDNLDIGLFVLGSDAVVERTVVRGTRPLQLDQTGGSGVIVQPDPQVGTAASLALRDSLVEDNHNIGVLALGAEVHLSASIVRRTLPQASDGISGRGLNLQRCLTTGIRGHAVVEGSRIEDNHEVGVLVGATDAVMTGTIVRGTMAQLSDGMVGRGLSVQHHVQSGEHASLSMGWSVIDQNFDCGLALIASDLELHDSVVRATSPRQANGLLGDAIAVVTKDWPAHASIRSTLVESSARVGVSVFGADTSVSGTRFECNAIHLGTESVHETPGALVDGGDNVCGCGPLAEDCRAISSGLAPPEPLGPADQAR